MSKFKKKIENSPSIILATLIGGVLGFLLNSTTGLLDIYDRYKDSNESANLAIRQMSIQSPKQIDAELTLSNPTKTTASFSGLQLVAKNKDTNQYVTLLNYRIFTKSNGLVYGPSSPINVGAGETHNIFVEFDRENSVLPHSYTEAFFIWKDTSGKRHLSEPVNIEKVAHLVRG